MGVYVVTGGAGFIGSHVVDFLVSRGEKVRVVDNLITGKMENLNESIHKITFIRMDINDHENLCKVFSGADFVIHLAALPSVLRSVEDPMSANHHNINGSLSVFEAAKKAGVKKVVYASSSSVYGDSKELPKHEGMESRPKSPYAFQKFAVEKYAQFYTGRVDCEYVGLRFFNVFGPRQSPDSVYAGVIPKFVKFEREGKPLTIYGDGNQTRDFTYVLNVVNGIYLACQTKGLSGKIINVAAGKEIVLIDMVKLLESILGRKLDIIHLPENTAEVKRSVADISLARELLGYEPEVSFEEGFAKTIEYLQNQQN